MVLTNGCSTGASEFLRQKYENHEKKEKGTYIIRKIGIFSAILYNTLFDDCAYLCKQRLKTKMMLGHFAFHHPTKLHFGEDALSKMGEELTNRDSKEIKR